MSEVRQYLYTLRVKRVAMLQDGPNEKESATLQSHFEYLEDLSRRGVVLLAGRTQNSDATTFGIVIYRADSETAARGIMDADPAVREGVMQSELFPFKTALLGDPWKH